LQSNSFQRVAVPRGWRADLLGAEMIEDVPDVLRRRARLALGLRGEEREVLVERHDALVLRVGLSNLLAQR
jgi:hypothetical protein